MDHPKGDAPKLPEMVMCGDHPSFIKTEMNVKDIRADVKEKEKLKERPPMSFAKLSPSTSGTGANEQRIRTMSEHKLRLLDARHRVRSLEMVRSPDDDITAHGNRSLVQAALGSFRWPPYLLAIWVIVLLLTHILHCLVSILERSLPTIKNLCQYFRKWTEDCWKMEPSMNHRVYPLALACLTGLSYTLYFGLYALYSIAVWSIEPLHSDAEEKRSTIEGREVEEVKITNYEDVGSKTNTSINP